MHFLPYCKITLKAAKFTPFPKEPQSIGDHLTKRRYERRLFQKDVALLLQVDNWTVCNWENNKTIPAVRYLPRIIQFLEYYPYPAPETLGERLLACRRYLGLSRKRIAQRLSVDEGTLAKWERGTL
ncbi:MAG: helix-turn-helix transcriptional regulator, partial [Alphaproteobacteria bacterium]|nr:helix-turn-helix transcriptional regulator [Alphaproteobacteria bacterium]